MGTFLFRASICSKCSSDEARGLIAATFKDISLFELWYMTTGLILGLRPANERRRYFVTTSLIGWAQT